MFHAVVELYRACGRPPVVDSTFAFEGVCSARLERAIRSCEKLGEQFGRFLEPLAIEEDRTVSLVWCLAANENARFYDTDWDLINGSLRPSQGVALAAYYIVSEDYMGGEEDTPELVARLKILVTLIQSLARISQQVASAPNDPLSLIFVIPADENSPPRTIQLITHVTVDTVRAATINIGVLRSLTEANTGELHVEERKSLFRLAVADILGNTPGDRHDFTYLVSHWKDVLAKYHYDVDVYISRFSFDKVRKEIAKAEVDFVTNIQTVVGESSSKLLGLPLSLAAVIGIYHATSLVESLLLALGALFIALIFSGVTENQRLQLQRIDQAFKTVFDPLTDKANSLPAIITERLDCAKKAFAKQLRFSSSSLMVIRILGWVPVLMAVGATAYKFHPGFHAYVLKVATLLLI